MVSCLEAAQDGVDCKYMIDKSTPTGACAVTILNKERSLTTNLHAANNYKAGCLFRAPRSLLNLLLRACSRAYKAEQQLFLPRFCL